MRLVWKLLRGNISVAQFTGFAVASLVGMTVVLGAVQAYRDVRPIVDRPDSFLRGDYLILSKKVSPLQALGVGSSDFTAAELDELARQPFVNDLGRFTPAQYRVTGSIDMGDMMVSTYLFFEAVPDRFLDVASDEWRFDEGDGFIPIIVPKNYLNLYNFGFARSQGLPQLSQELFGAVEMDVDIAGGGHREGFRGRIVAFSNRLNTILVPQSFIDWSNSRFGDGDDGDPARVIIEVSNRADEALGTYLKARDYEIEGENGEGNRVAWLLRLATGVVAGVGALITLLALFILILSIFLLLEKNTRKLEDLMLLGYTATQVSAPYRLLTAAVNIAVLAAAMIAVLVARGRYMELVASLDDTYQSPGVWTTVAIGVAVTVALTLVDWAVIGRKVAALQKKR